jgi:hypothetical protein
LVVLIGARCCVRQRWRRSRSETTHDTTANDPTPFTLDFTMSTFTSKRRGSLEVQNSTFPISLRSLLGEPIVDTSDVVVHSEDLFVGQMGTALALDRGTVLIDERASEWMQFAAGN